MDQGLFFAFFILVAILMVAGVVLSIRAAQKRREDLLAWATRNGLTYSSEHVSGFDEQYPWFSCLRNGDNRYAYNTIEGVYNKRWMLAFDYHYQTYSTDSKGNRQTHHHHFSAVLVNTGLPLEPLSITGESIFNRIGEFFGAGDIDFESTEFSDQFRVTSPNKRWAYDVLHQSTMEFLLTSPRFALEMGGPFIIAWNSGTFEVEQFEQAVQVIDGIITRLPNYLVRELKGKD
jgi:hypothetical protein